MNPIRRIKEWRWRRFYGDRVSIVWPDDVVVVENRPSGSEYHKPGAIERYPFDVPADQIEVTTRRWAEMDGASPCTECFADPWRLEKLRPKM